MTENAPTDLSALVDHTSQLVDQAELVDSWGDDERRLIRDAHSAGMTVEEYENDIDGRITYAESFGDDRAALDRRAELSDDDVDGY